MQAYENISHDPLNHNNKRFFKKSQ